ncbi:MAG TPA: hypothetical protein VJ183_13885 [Chloroflexia bacterium]|nr:hypothetical protein [Chloroflexia bacterium]
MWNLPPVAAHIAELLFLLAFSSVALGVGLRLLHLLALSPILSLGERLVFGFAIGYGALGFAMLGMGLLGVLYLPIGLVVLAILAVAGCRPLVKEMRLAFPAIRSTLSNLRYPPNAFLASVIVVAVVVALCKVLVPVATQDDLMYHLALPRRYVEAHSVGFYPDSTYSLFPQLMEMLNTWGLLLGSDRLALLFSFSVSLLGPVSAALFAKRYLGGEGVGAWRAMPLLVAAIFLTTPLVGYVLRAANTDLAQASFDLLAVYALIFWILDFGFWKSNANKIQNPKSKIQNPPDPRPLVLAGICCGLSFSVKYYGFAMAVALGGALAVVLIYRHRRLARQSRSTAEETHTTRPLSVLVKLRSWQAAPAFLLLYFAMPILDLAMPWLLRNIVASGNPVWPLAGNLLGGAYWSPDASPEKLLGVAPPFSLANLWTGAEFVWSAYIRGPIYIDNQIHVVNLGTLLLPALLTLPFGRWKPAVRWLAYAAGVYWVIWAFFFSRTSIRYLSTFFLLAALLGAYGLVSMAVRYHQLRWVVAGVTGVALGFLAIQTALSVGPYLPTVLSIDRAAERQYLTSYMQDYPIMQYIADKTPPDATIYVWDGQPRGYYIPRKYVYARLVPLYTGFGGEIEQWHARLVELGITHVLFHNRRILAPGQPLDFDPEAQDAQRFAARYFSPPLLVVGEYVLYELR